MRRIFGVVASVAILAQPSWGVPEFLDAFTARYATRASKLNSCQVCHASNSGFNVYGSDLETKLRAGSNLEAALAALEPLDSDGDGHSNLAEINARTWPGDPADSPVAVEAVTWSKMKYRYTTLPR